MSSDNTCNSRHFSWLMKSCFPNQQNHHQPSPISAAASATTISALPDDLLLECLCRVDQSSLLSLAFVCRRWAHLINSPSFHHLRHHHNLLFNTIFSICISRSALFAASLRMSHQFESPTWKVSTFIPSSPSLHLENGSVFSLFSHYRLVSIGRKIYIIGRTAMLRCDTWTGTLVPKAGMGFPRKKFAAAEVAGKIYVACGSARSEAVEEYDPDENEWRVVSHAPRRRYGCVGAAVDGVFYVIGGLKIGVAGNEAAHVYASSMDLYDVEARGWLRSRAVPGGGCVVAACAANGHLYILSSHAVELSFWKFNGSRKSGEFGEWRRIKPPPLPAQVRLDSTVGFSCVGVGNTVVLIQVVGCIDDLLRRSGRSERGLKEGLVLVYDCATGIGVERRTRRQCFDAPPVFVWSVSVYPKETVQSRASIVNRTKLLTFFVESRKRSVVIRLGVGGSDGNYGEQGGGLCLNIFMIKCGPCLKFVWLKFVVILGCV